MILEESPYIGGISRTAEHHGNRMDLGGHRFFSKNEDIMNLWREIMPVQGAPAKDDLLIGREKPLVPGGPDPEKTDRVMLVRGRVSRIFYLRKFFDYPISLKAQTFLNMGFKRTMKAGFGYMRAAMFKRKEASLGDFYINRFGKPLYEMFFEDYTEKVWGVHPSQISPDWGSQRVKGLSLSKAVFSILKKPFVKKDSKKVETSLIEEFNYPKKGPGQLWEQLAELVREKGGDIRMNTSVTRIHTADGHVTAVTAVSGGEELRVAGDYFFSTMPVKDLVCGMDGAVPRRGARDRRGASLPRLYHGRPASLKAGAEKRDEDENREQHRPGLLDLHPGARCEDRPPAGFQQLVPVYGQGYGEHGFRRPRVFLQRGRRHVDDA